MITRHVRGVAFLIAGWILAGFVFYLVYTFPEPFIKILFALSVGLFIFFFSVILYIRGSGRY